MARIAEYLEHPSLLFHAPRSHHLAHHHPKTMFGGLALLLLGIVGLVWMWPELQRYMRMRRM